MPSLLLLSLSFLPTDTWANSCFPEITTTFNTQTPAAEFSVSSDTYSASSSDSTTSASATTRAPPLTTMARKTKMICITEVYTEPITMDAETEASVESGAAFKNEAAGFGGECLLGLYGVGKLDRQGTSSHTSPDRALSTYQPQIKA